MNGIIYILSHEAMPNLLKIGYTDRTVEERVKELASSTGVPGKFTVELYFETENASLFEQTLFKVLSNYHFKKEFYKIDINTVIFAIHNLLDEDKKHLYVFKGKSSIQATTEAQLEHQRKIRDEKQIKKRNFLEEKAKKEAIELKKHTDKSTAELINEISMLCSAPSKINLIEANKIQRVLYLRQQEELKIVEEKYQEKRRKFLESNDYQVFKKNKIVYETDIKWQFIRLGNEVNNIVIAVSPEKNTLLRKITYAVLGYNFDDGKKISKVLNQKQREIILKFFKMLSDANNLTKYSNLSSQEEIFLDEFNLRHNCLHDLQINPHDKNNYLITEDREKLTDYFKGILEGCKSN